MDIEKHTPGMFSWADLGSPDAAASRRFYSELLQVDAMGHCGLPMLSVVYGVLGHILNRVLHSNQRKLH